MPIALSWNAIGLGRIGACLSTSNRRRWNATRCTATCNYMTTCLTCVGNIASITFTEARAPLASVLIPGMVSDVSAQPLSLSGGTAPCSDNSICISQTRSGSQISRLCARMKVFVIGCGNRRVFASGDHVVDEIEDGSQAGLDRSVDGCPATRPPKPHGPLGTGVSSAAATGAAP